MAEDWRDQYPAPKAPLTVGKIEQLSNANANDAIDFWRNEPVRMTGGAIEIASTIKPPVSTRIKTRLKEANKRFFACDNVSDFIQDGEKEELILELTGKFNSVLDSLIIDRESDPNSKDTGKRLAKMYINEIMSGRYAPQPDSTAFPNDDEDAYKGMLVVRAEIKSMCSHHHQPVTGVAYIGVIPHNKVIGLSKYMRLAQWAARRGTLQEELTTHISKLIKQATESNDVAVYVEAEHGCCTNRGIMANSSLTQTTVLSGMFHDHVVKSEFFDQVKLQKAQGN